MRRKPGGYGYMLEYPIARDYADARISRIYGGTNEIMREVIGRGMGLRTLANRRRGPNGAGKTTLLRAASLLSVSAGQVRLSGSDVTRQPPYRRAVNGLCLVPEGRGIFPNLSVRENLLLQVPPTRKDVGYEPALEAFPILSERLAQRAGSMSGGQQQMLALSRCFLSDPSVVLLDEVSMGLAPRIIDEIFDALVKLSQNGVALLLVEQYVNRALGIADHVYLLGRGRITFSGPPNELDEAELIRRYVGAAG